MRSCFARLNITLLQLGVDYEYKICWGPFSNMVRLAIVWQWPYQIEQIRAWTGIERVCCFLSYSLYLVFVINYGYNIWTFNAFLSYSSYLLIWGPRFKKEYAASTLFLVVNTASARHNTHTRKERTITNQLKIIILNLLQKMRKKQHLYSLPFKTRILRIPVLWLSENSVTTIYCLKFCNVH